MPLRREAALASKLGPKHAKKLAEPQNGDAETGEKEKKEKKKRWRPCAARTKSLSINTTILMGFYWTRKLPLLILRPLD